MNLKPFALALASLATSLTGAFAQDDLLSPVAGFAPTLNFSDNYSERTARRFGELEIVASERLTAKIVANLTNFDASELTADTPVSISVGGFQFEGLIQDFLPTDRDGNPAEFTTATKGGTFFYKAEKLDANGDPKTDRNGDPIYEKVGSIQLSWTATRLTVDVKIRDALLAGVGSIGEDRGLIGLADDGVRGGTLNFANEAVPVLVTFGSASGQNFSYAKGNTKTIYRKIGGELTPLNSATAIGAADTKAPTLTVTLPSNDGGNGVIDFSGTVVDIAPGTLPNSDSIALVDVAVYVNDPDFIAGLPADEVTDADAAGKHSFTFTNIPLDPGANTVVLVATDESGNRTVITKTVNSIANPTN